MMAGTRVHCVHAASYALEDSMATTFRSLSIWQLAMDLTQEVYRLSGPFHRDEQFGITAQICRAAVSLPNNIADGHGSGSDAEFRHFLTIARGSLREVDTQVVIATRLGFHTEIATKKFEELARRVVRMLTNLIHILDVNLSKPKREPRSAKLAALP